MKKIYVLLVTIALFNFTMKAEDGKFEKAMKDQLEKLEKASDKESLVEIANAFERIAKKESDNWLPAYYAGYSHLFRSHFLRGDLASVDSALDEAEKWADKAAELAPDEDEIVVLQGYIDMMRLSADPANRGQRLSPVVMQQFGKAMQMDPENPRAMLMMAQMKMGSAQFFGSGTEEPCGMAKASISLFEAENPEPLYPRWGKDLAVEMVESCDE